MYAGFCVGVYWEEFSALQGVAICNARQCGPVLAVCSCNSGHDTRQARLPRCRNNTALKQPEQVVQKRLFKWRDEYDMHGDVPCTRSV